MLELVKDNRSGDRLELVVFTYNEQRRIRNILNCYRNRFDVVILDGRSTDLTVPIAVESGATVFTRMDNTIGESVFVHYANEISASGLSFYLLCDEFVHPDDLESVTRELREHWTCVQCRKAEWVYGRRMLTLDHIEPRAFRKGYASYDPDHLHRNLNMVVQPDAQMCPRLYQLHHLHIWSVPGYFGKIGLYSDIEIKQFERGSRPLRRFVRRYVASLFGFPLIKVWREKHIGLPRTLFWILFDLAELTIASLSWIEQSHLMTPEQQLDLYSTFYSCQARLDPADT